jgi:hypothetical protein
MNGYVDCYAANAQDEHRSYKSFVQAKLLNVPALSISEVFFTDV